MKINRIWLFFLVMVISLYFGATLVKAETINVTFSNNVAASIEGNKLIISSLTGTMAAPEGTYNLKNGFALQTDPDGVILFDGEPIELVRQDGKIIQDGREVGNVY